MASFLFIMSLYVVFPSKTIHPPLGKTTIPSRKLLLDYSDDQSHSSVLPPIVQTVLPSSGAQGSIDRPYVIDVRLPYNQGNIEIIFWKFTQILKKCNDDKLLSQ
eukprot:GHVR01024905.1.p1 GENE.GHVR01024905.1~~GHVR01024905.1.p1  ORF type:complete len:104 (+),score=4.45 GHVR01024905.1:2870-3181(+)